MDEHAEAPASAAPSGTLPSDVVKRTSGPTTTNGTRWEVQLSTVPSPAWLAFFAQAARASVVSATAPRPQRVTFDRASLVFKCHEDHVAAWVEAIDTWIGWTEARHKLSLDEASRNRTIKLDDEAKQRARIQAMNDRFKDL